MRPTGDDREVPTSERLDEARVMYSRVGIGGRVGIGERPAILVVDFQYGFTEPASPLGGNLDEVVAATASLLEVGRRNGLPVAFTAVSFQKSHLDRLAWLRKMPGLVTLIEGTHWCEIDERVKPLPGEPLFRKQAASGFFGTSLVTFLLGCDVDSLIIAGCVTSGCVRATVVDAVSWGFRTIVAAECVGDRAAGPHTWNMFDMDSKYADVEPLDDVIARLNGPDDKLPGSPVAQTAG
jgi:maleamate amidohydrolase